MSRVLRLPLPLPLPLPLLLRSMAVGNIGL